MKYLVVVEKTKTGYSAYSPDLGGCVATGRTRTGVVKQMQRAIVFHLEGIRAEGGRVPPPSTFSAYVEVVA